METITVLRLHLLLFDSVQQLLLLIGCECILVFFGRRGVNFLTCISRLFYDSILFNKFNLFYGLVNSLLCPEDKEITRSTGFARSFRVNAMDYWLDQNSNFGVFSRAKSRDLSHIKSGTVILMEDHTYQNFKYQGMTWYSNISVQADYDGMSTDHMRNKFNFLYEDGHVEGGLKSILMMNARELLRAVD